MKNREYWESRFTAVEALTHKSAAEYASTLEREFKTASAEIEKQISSWYQRFADNNQISLADVRKWLNAGELKELKWDVREYIKYGEENAITGSWAKQLENASVKVHISRLESLKLQLQQQIEVLYGNQTDGIDDLLKKVYSDRYYHTAFEIQKGFNVGYDLMAVNDTQLKKALSTPWTTDNKTFSDRIWAQKTRLISSVQTQLTQAIMRGDSPDKAIKAISKEFNVSQNQAARLVMTESAYIASEAQEKCYRDLDVEKYEILATLDSRTSEICQELDGQVLDMKDYRAGVTAPPFHPWCRTVTVPWFEDDYGVGERAARGEDGKTYYVPYYVPSNMKYSEWKAKYIDGTSLTSPEESDIINISYKELNTPEELISFIGESEREFIASLSDVQKSNIYEYTTSGAKECNTLLRSSNPAPSPYYDELMVMIDSIDESINSFILDAPIKTYRAVPKGVAFQGVTNLSDLIGTEYSDPAFLSTTPLYSAVIDYAKSYRFDTIFDISLKGGKGKGAYINSLSEYEDKEYELLLKRGAKFRINDVKAEDGYTIIVMEEIE